MKKTLIAASVGALMLAAAGTASANSLLFPFFTTAGGASSSVSISGNTASDEVLHYVYNYATGTDNCAHYDASGSITKNDLMQHSIAAPAQGGFGMATPGDKSKPVYLPVKGTQGFLTVTNTTSLTPKAISGDMLLVDPATNLVFSYAGISNDLNTQAVAGVPIHANEGNFAALPALEGKNFNLSFYPQGAVATTWYALVTGNMNSSIKLANSWDATAYLTSGLNVYDNDEQPFSGATTKKFTCSGNVAVADLMTGAQYSAVGTNGGLMHAAATFAPVGPTATNVGDNLSLYKIQIATAAVAAPLTSKVFIHRESGAAF